MCQTLWRHFAGEGWPQWRFTSNACFKMNTDRENKNSGQRTEGYEKRMENE